MKFQKNPEEVTENCNKSYKKQKGGSALFKFLLIFQIIRKTIQAGEPYLPLNVQLAGHQIRYIFSKMHLTKKIFVVYSNTGDSNNIHIGVYDISTCSLSDTCPGITTSRLNIFDESGAPIAAGAKSMVFDFLRFSDDDPKKIEIYAHKRNNNYFYRWKCPFQAANDVDSVNAEHISYTGSLGVPQNDEYKFTYRFNSYSEESGTVPFFKVQSRVEPFNNKMIFFFDENGDEKVVRLQEQESYPNWKYYDMKVVAPGRYILVTGSSTACPGQSGCVSFRMVDSDLNYLGQEVGFGELSHPNNPDPRAFTMISRDLVIVRGYSWAGGAFDNYIFAVLIDKDGVMTKPWSDLKPMGNVKFAYGEKPVTQLKYHWISIVVRTDDSQSCLRLNSLTSDANGDIDSYTIDGIFDLTGAISGSAHGIMHIEYVPEHNFFYNYNVNSGNPSELQLKIPNNLGGSCFEYPYCTKCTDGNEGSCEVCGVHHNLNLGLCSCAVASLSGCRYCGDKSNCTLCETGKVKVTTQATQLVESCILEASCGVGNYVNGTNHCVSCQGIDPQCATCDNSGQCLSCSEGYRIEGGACVPCSITGCAICDTSGASCDECSAGLFLHTELGQADQCQSDCSSPVGHYEKTTTPGVCGKCNEDFGVGCTACSLGGCANCEQYFDGPVSGRCDSCIENAFLNPNNQCQLVLEGCIEMDEVNGVCLECHEDYYLASSDSLCKLCKENLSQAKEEDTSFCQFTKEVQFTDMTSKGSDDMTNVFKFEIEGSENPKEDMERLITDNFEVKVEPAEAETSIFVNEEEKMVEMKLKNDVEEATVSFILQDEEFQPTGSDRKLTLVNNTEALNFQLKNTKSRERDEIPEEDQGLMNAIFTGALIATYASILLTYVATLSNVDFTGMVFKIIQIVLFFDKLRLINIKLTNKTGTLLKIFNDLFSADLIESQDYFKVTKTSKNEFQRGDVTVIVYRRKVDKIVVMILSLVLLLLKNYYLKKLKNKTGVTFKKAEKMAKRIIKLQNLAWVLFVSSVVDVIFYCGHQLIHQRYKTFIASFEYSFTLIISCIAFLYASFMLAKAIQKTNSFTKKQLREEASRKFVKEAVISPRGQVSPMNDERKKLSKSNLRKRNKKPQRKISNLKLNLKKTVEKISLKNEFLLTYLSDGLNPETIEKIPNWYNLALTLRFLTSCLFILTFQSFPLVQIVFFSITELIYIGFIILSQRKYKALYSKFDFIVKILESFTLINLGIFCTIYLLRDRTNIATWDSIILFLFVITMAIQYCQLMVFMLKVVWKLIFRRKKKNQNLLEDGIKIDQKVEGKPFEYWIGHELLAVEPIYRKGSQFKTNKLQLFKIDDVQVNKKRRTKSKGKGKNRGKFIFNFF